jgi:Holliday junction resolvase RusA-like endonuclease
VDLPWDFVVPGVPVSIQTKNKRRKAQYRAQVAAAARAAWPDPAIPPLTGELQIHITYYHDNAPLDTDNSMKLIQDALVGIVYEDDDQLVDRHGHRRDKNKPYRLVGFTRVLADGFLCGGPFVHVRIEEQGDEVALP